MINGRHHRLLFLDIVAFDIIIQGVHILVILVHVFFLSKL